MHETLFAAVTYGMFGPWLLLVLAPRWRLGQAVLGSVVLPLALATLYAWLFVRGMAQPAPEAPPPGLMARVMTSFSRPEVVLAAWVHFLLFDFLVGVWIVRDAQARGVAHLLVIPCLALSFMAGPAGLLVYLLLRTVLRKGGLALCAGPGSRQGAEKAP